MHIFDQDGARSYVEAMLKAKTDSAFEDDERARHPEQHAAEPFWQFLLNLVRSSNGSKHPSEKLNR
jgi:hypothetical protein